MTREEIMAQLMQINKDRSRIIELEKLMDEKELTQAERDICQSQIELFNEKYQRILNAIKKLEFDSQKIVILRHYILGETIEQLSATMNYSPRQLSRISRRGIENLIRILNMS